MSDILFGDDAKLKVRLFAYFLQKELTKMAKAKGMVIPDGKTFLDSVHDDLRNNTNPGVRKAYRKLMEAGGYMKENHQAAIISDLGASFLWFVVKDTAYRDPFFWVINDLFNDKDFISGIQPYVIAPSKWYCPSWHDSKNVTKDKHANGELPLTSLSDAENVYVPSYQEGEWKKIQDDMKKQYDLHKR